MMLFVIYGVIKGFTVRSITTLDPELLLLTFCMLAKHWSNLSTSPTTHGTLYSLSFLNGKTFCFLMKPTFHVLDPRSEKRNPIWAHRRVATNKTHQRDSYQAIFYTGYFCVFIFFLYPQNNITDMRKLRSHWNFRPIEIFRFICRTF